MKSALLVVSRRFSCALLLVSAVTPFAQAAVVTQQSIFKSGLAGAAPLAMSVTGQQAYAGSVTTGALTVFQRDGTGSFAPATTYDAAVASGEAGAHALQSLALSPDDRHLYAGYITLSDPSAALIAVLRRDADGALGFLASIPVAGGGRLSALSVSADGANVYAVVNNSLYVYSRNAQTGQLAEQQQLNADVDGVDGLAGAWAVAPSPDGRFIYVTAEDEHTLAVFRRDSGGQLTFLAVYKNAVNGIGGLGDARGVVVSPDGKQVYVAAAGDNAVTVFSRDTATGLLQLKQVYRDGVQGVDGLGGAFALALSPEGSQLYALGSAEAALAVFRRDAVNGELAQVGVLREAQGSPAVEGLSGAWGLSVHPGGQQLLVTSPGTNSLAVFAVAAADLNLVMQVDANTKTAGEIARFQLIVTNNGPAAATGVVVENSLPAGVGAVNGAVSQAPCEQATARLRCRIGGLAPGGRATVDIDMELPQAGSYLNAAAAAADQRDLQPGDNRDQVTLNVNPSVDTNRAPVAAADRADTRPGVAVDIPVLANDHDPDGDSFSVSSLSAVSQHGGSLSINADGGVRYTPAGGFHGLDDFTYTITDAAGAAAQAEVQVMVNTPPDARDDFASVTAGTTASIHVLVNDVDADGDALSLVSAETPSVRGGTVSINGDGTVAYTAAAGFIGEDSFNYTLNDGNGGSDTARVNLVVTAPAGGNSATPPAPQAQPNQKRGGGSMRPAELAMLLSCLLLASFRRLNRRR